MLAIHDVVRIVDLRKPEDEWNGTLALCISEEYIHSRLDCRVIKIKIGDGLWAIEVGHVEKVDEEERLQYFRNLESNKIVEWSQCHWKPDLKRKDFNI
jgi:hypothetical protein